MRKNQSFKMQRYGIIKQKNLAKKETLKLKMTEQLALCDQ